MKKTALIVALLLIHSISVDAAVFGNVLNSFSNDMGAYSVFHKTEFDDELVGKQTEFYVEYTPNTDAVPVVANDGSQWGQSDINTVADKVYDEGNRVVAGINADYFSFKTGLPMGTTISGGELVSKVDEAQPAIGFREDGTAFIDNLEVDITALHNGKSVDIMCLNKWYQHGFDPIFMLNDKFGNNSKTNGNCIFVICSPSEGDMKINTDMQITVEEHFEYHGEIAIPDGKIILVIDKDFGKPEMKDFINGLNIGDEVTLQIRAVNSEKNLWGEAVEGTSTVGGRLLKNGEIGSGFEAGIAPRTAIGIKPDGNIIMYTLDGRQTGYSYGATITDLAHRMKELGCVDAINLDGGGSTVMSALLSGSDSFKVMNSPSDGNPRSVANYIFLKDNRKPTGEIWIANVQNLYDTYYLGDEAELNIECYDTNNYKMEDTSGVEISVENAVLNDRKIYFDIVGNVLVKVHDKEYSITVHRQYFSDIQMHWAKQQIEAMSDIEIINGTETENGYIFNPDNQMTRSEFAAIISRFQKLDLSEYESVQLPFEDYSYIQEWAVPYIKAVYGSGIMNGKSDDGGETLYFDPNSPVTRAEAMTMLNRVLQIENYSETAFADDDDIPEWARDGITKLVSAGIVKGYSDNTIRPNNSITRAEGTVMLYNCQN